MIVAISVYSTSGSMFCWTIQYRLNINAGRFKCSDTSYAVEQGYRKIFLVVFYKYDIYYCNTHVSITGLLHHRVISVSVNLVGLSKIVRDSLIYDDISRAEKRRCFMFTRDPIHCSDLTVIVRFREFLYIINTKNREICDLLVLFPWYGNLSPVLL